MKVFAKIDPCPINEAIFEVRFDSEFDEAAVFGVIYNELRAEFSKTADLPVLQLPASIRKTEKELIFQPYYRLTALGNKNRLIQVGPRVFSVILTNNEYPGWDSFLKDINFGLEKLKKSNVVNKVTRIALRYLNFFDGNILLKSTLSLKLDNRILNDLKTQVIGIEIPDGDFISKLSVYNSAIMKLTTGPQNGSVIDIDTSLEREIPDFFEHKDKLLHECHQVEKRLFSSLFTSEYIDNLKEVKYE